MKLYTNVKGQWVGTQYEARKIDAWQTDVPTDKPSLLAWLNDKNEFWQSIGEQHADQTGSLPTASEPPATRWDIRAAADTASLQDLQYVVYKYMMRIDDELDLKKELKV